MNCFFFHDFFFFFLLLFFTGTLYVKWFPAIKEVSNRLGSLVLGCVKLLAKDNKQARADKKQSLEKKASPEVSNFWHSFITQAMLLCWLKFLKLRKSWRTTRRVLKIWWPRSKKFISVLFLFCFCLFWLQSTVAHVTTCSTLNCTAGPGIGPGIDVK
jgi:hypothetical protein